MKNVNSQNQIQKILDSIKTVTKTTIKNTGKVIGTTALVTLLAACPPTVGPEPEPPPVVEPTITSSIVDLYFEGGIITNTKITNNLSDNTQSLPSYSSNLNDTDIKTLTPNTITSLTPYIVSLVRLNDNDTNTNENLSFINDLSISLGNLGIALENVNATHGDDVEIIVNSAVVDFSFNNGRITSAKITKHLSDNTTQISNINGLNIPTDALTPAYIKSIVSDNVTITVNLADTDKNSKEDLSFKQGLITNLTNAGINFGTIDAVGNDDVVVINSATVDLSFNNGIITNTKITKHLSNNTTQISNSASLNKDIDTLTAADIKSIVSDNVAITVNVRDADPSSTEDLSFKQGLITNLTNAGITIGTIDALPDTNLTINTDYTIETHNPADFNGMDVTISFDPSVEKFDINKLVEYKNNLTAAGANVSFDFSNVNDVNEVSIDLTDNIGYMNELYNTTEAEVQNLNTGTFKDKHIIPGLLSVRSYMLLNDGSDKYIKQAFVINGSERHLSVNTTSYDVGGYKAGIIMEDKNSSVDFSDGVEFITNLENSIPLEDVKYVKDFILGNDDISTEEKRLSYSKPLPKFSLKVTDGFSDHSNLYGIGIDHIVALYNEKGQSSKFDFSSSSALDFDAETFLGNNTMYTGNGEYNQGSAYKMHIDMLRYVEGEIKNVEVSGTHSGDKSTVHNSNAYGFTNVYFSSDLSGIELGDYFAAGVLYFKTSPKSLPTSSKQGYIILESVGSNTSIDVNNIYAFNISKITDSNDLTKFKNVTNSNGSDLAASIKELYAADVASLKALQFYLDVYTSRIIYVNNGLNYIPETYGSDLNTDVKSLNPEVVSRNATIKVWEEAAREGDKDTPVLPPLKGTLPTALTNKIVGKVNLEPTFMDLLTDRQRTS